MKPFWETVTFENSYVPLKVYELLSVDDEHGLYKVSALTQPGYIQELKSMCCGSFVHCHKYLECLYILEDHVRIQINGEVQYADKGDLVLINSYDVHEVDGRKSHWVLLFDPSKMQHFPKDQSHNLFPKLNQHKLIKAADQNQLKGEMIRDAIEKTLTTLRETQGYGNLETTGQFYLLLHAIADYTQHLNEDESDIVHYKDQQFIHDILQYLEEHFHEKLALETIAKRAGFSKNYFCRFFKKTTGRSFVNYLNEMRCQRARELIETTEMAITTIALDTGFSSVSYFSRKFREYWGVAPSELRG